LGAVFLAEVGAPVARRSGPRGETALAFYGIAHLDDAPRDPRTLAEQLLDRYLDGGREALCGLNGTYVVAVLEDAPRRLTLIKDRAGYSKLFYWSEGGRLMFASEYKAISWHPSFDKAVNPVCVADIFLYRTPLEGRTLFRDVHSLPPAGVLTFEEGRARVDTYWKIRHCPPGTPEKTDEQYADELAERFRTAVRRRVRPNACLLITGGLDSRIVAGFYQAEAAASGLVASTIGQPAGQDVQVGRSLARALNIPHHHIPLGCDYLARYAAPGTWRSEGKNGAYASWILAQAPFMAARGLRYTLSGLFGNYISARHYPKETFRARTLAEGIAAVEGNLNPYLSQLQGILRPEVFASAARESAATLSMIFRRAETDDLIQKTDEFNFYFRVCRHGNTEDSLGDVSQALETFLDIDVFDYAIGQIPPRARARALFYHQIIARHLPQAARVVNGSTDMTIPAEIALHKTPLLKDIETYRRKALKRLFPAQFGHEARACVPHNDAIRGGSRAFVERLFAQEDAYADLFEPAAARALLEDHLAGRANAFMMIDAMVTFILWRKQFCDLDGPLEALEPEAEVRERA
jgi:asparagine synthetase B (glutamine-hydrolysing)